MDLIQLHDQVAAITLGIDPHQPMFQDQPPTGILNHRKEAAFGVMQRRSEQERSLEACFTHLAVLIMDSRTDFHFSVFL